MEEVIALQSKARDAGLAEAKRDLKFWSAFYELYGDALEKGIEYKNQLYADYVMLGSNLLGESILKIHSSGKIVPVRRTALVQHVEAIKGNYVWSNAALGRARRAEIALKAWYEVRNFYHIFLFDKNPSGVYVNEDKRYGMGLFTLTFPPGWTNERRYRVNDRIRKLMRVNFPAGMWVCEAHTKKLVGLYHFHYRFCYDLTRYKEKDLIAWKDKQAVKDGVPKNGYNMSFGYDQKSIYCGMHESKKQQKELVSWHSPVWSKWGYDVRPEYVLKEALQASGIDMYSCLESKEVRALNVAIYSQWIKHRREHIVSLPY